jgi:hypothetical protein
MNFCACGKHSSQHIILNSALFSPLQQSGVYSLVVARIVQLNQGDRLILTSTSRTVTPLMIAVIETT